MSHKPFQRHVIRDMPKHVPEQEINAILAIVATHTEGVPVGIIRAGLPHGMAPRLLQRRQDHENPPADDCPWMMIIVLQSAKALLSRLRLGALRE